MYLSPQVTVLSYALLYLSEEGDQVDLSQQVITVLSYIVRPVADIWNWVDSVYIFPNASLLDVFVAAFVVSSCLWLVFGFNERNGGD